MTDKHEHSRDSVAEIKRPATETLQIRAETLHYERSRNFDVAQLTLDCGQELIDIIGPQDYVDTMTEAFKGAEDHQPPSLTDIIHTYLRLKGASDIQAESLELLGKIKNRLAENTDAYLTRQESGEIPFEEELVHLEWGYEQNSINIKQRVLDEATEDLTASSSRKLVNAVLRKMTGSSRHTTSGYAEVIHDPARLVGDLESHQGSILEVYLDQDVKNDQEAMEIVSQATQELSSLQAQILEIRTEYVDKFRDGILPFKRKAISALEAVETGSDEARVIGAKIIEDLEKQVGAVKQQFKDERDSKITPLQEQIDALEQMIARLSRFLTSPTE